MFPQEEDVYKALRESEARYRELVENANSIILRWSKDGIITYFNEYAQKFFGYSKEEIIGKHVMDTIVPDNESSGRNLRPLMEDICKNPEKYESNINENVTKSGKRVWVAWTNKVLSDEDGNIIGALSIGSDITKQHQLEEELRHAHKMEAVGQLAGGIAHDFNNMLQGILGCAQLIRRNTENEKQTRHANNIIKTSHQAADLIKQLLTFSRQDKLQKSKFDVHNIIEEVISILSHTIDRKISINKKLYAPISSVVGDAPLIKNALLNIAINAKDAMQNGGILTFNSMITFVTTTEKINSKLELNKGSYLYLTIEDTGIGMSEDIRKKIFEPFFTTKETGQGTGLGLSTVYGTITNHNGAVNCISKPNEGSKFEIYLPLNDIKTNKEENSLSYKSTLKDKSFMLVDDEELVRKNTKELFEKSGYKVTTFSDPSEAIEHYKSFFNQFDFVMLDMIMPKMNGKELFNELKNINPDIKAILSSGYSMENDLKEILEQGMMGQLQKPYSVEQLEYKLSRLF